ncbi:MAG: AI-2E family transporter [Candidatus Micrarchaeia archaeon]|jgi:predicted PurR-regulated permease PerM
MAVPKNNDAENGKEKKTRTILAGVLVLAMLYLVLTALFGYFNAFFVAIFSYIFLKPVYSFIRKHGLGKTSSALLSMTMGILVVGIPAIIFFQILISETSSLISPASEQYYMTIINQNLATLKNTFPGIEISDALKNGITSLAFQAVGGFKDLILTSIQSIGELALQSLVAIFVIYYLLVNEDNVGKLGRKLIPFNQKNTDKLIDESNRVTYSVLMSMGVMGVVQALPLTLVFMYFGVPGAVFWGFMALILTFIPFVGIPVVWIPIALGEWLGHNESAAIGIAIMGIILAVVENWRPIMQKYLGQVHPLVALLGVVIGIAKFGILGVLIGPLLLSYTLLAVGMFKEEYL